jgi:hypothetical protein
MDGIFIEAEEPTASLSADCDWRQCPNVHPLMLQDTSDPCAGDVDGKIRLDYMELP